MPHFTYNWFGRKGKAREDSQSTSLSDLLSSVGGIDLKNGVVVVNDETSLECPAYLRALNVIAQSVAVLPLRYMWEKNGVYVEKEGDNEHYLLSIQMMSGMSNYQFFYQLAFRCVHQGEALVYPRIIDGEVVEYVLIGDIHGNSWSHDKVNGIYTITDIENGVSGTFTENEVLHFVWNSEDGKTGKPLWELCAPALAIYLAGDSEALRRFQSGGNLAGIISNNVQASGQAVGQYKTTALEDMAEQIEEKAKQGNRIFAIGGDAKFSPFTMSSADMQFSDQQKRVVNEISRASGVPTYKLYVETSGTQYNTPEVSQKAYQTDTLEPMLHMIESEFQRKRVGRTLCHKRVYRFDRDAIYALDLKSKAEYYEKMEQIGAFSVNDVRRKENMPEIKGGDEALVSANLMTIEALKAKAEQPAQPTTVPDDSSEGEDPQKKEKPRDAKGRFIKR